MAKRTKSYGLNNPLQDVFPVPVIAQRSPTGRDNNYELGQTWINKSSQEVFSLAGIAAGQATWTILGGTGAFPITPFVVGDSSTAGYTTIQPALDAANAGGGGVVYIQPGTYIEDLVLYDNVDLYGTPAVSQPQGAGVSIVGTHTPPLTGHIGLNSIYFQDTSAIFSSTASGNTHIVLLNCESAVQNGYFFDLVNWNGILEIWDHNSDPSDAPFAVDDGGINNTGGSTVFIFSSGFGSGTSNVMNLGGPIELGQSAISSPVNFMAGSTSTVAGSQFLQPITFSGNSVGEMSDCQFVGGASAAITMSSTGDVSLENSLIQSSNNPAVDGSGAGILTLTAASFSDNAVLAPTLTLDNGIIRGGSFVSTFVVGSAPDAGYRTVQAGLDAANAVSGGTVYVQPGTFTENLTLYDQVDLIGAVGVGGSEACKIIGTHTPATTGTFTIKDIYLDGTEAIFSDPAAGSATIILENVGIEVATGFTFNLPNWTGKLIGANIRSNGSTDDGWVNNVGGADVFMTNLSMGAGTARTMVTSGLVELHNCVVKCPVDFQSGTDALIGSGSSLEKTLNFSGVSVGTLSNSTIITGTDPALIHNSSAAISLTGMGINSSNSPAIEGAGVGVLTLGGCDFGLNSEIATSLTIAGSNTKSGSFETIDEAEHIKISSNDIEVEGTTTDIDISLRPKGTGDVIVETGNFQLPTHGSEIQIAGGNDSDSLGTRTLAAGTVTVPHTGIAATDRIFLSRSSPGASSTLGILTYSIIASTSFTITAVVIGTPANTETNDISVIEYFIVGNL